MSNSFQSPTSDCDSVAAIPISQVEDQIGDIQLDCQYDAHNGVEKDDEMPLIATEGTCEQTLTPGNPDGLIVNQRGHQV